MKACNKVFLTVLFGAVLASGATAVAADAPAAGTAAAPAAAAPEQPMAINLAQQKFGHDPGLPACLSLAVLSGDPGKGPSLLLVKFKSGCMVPWHWHTPDEHIMLASGVGKAETKGGKTETLKAGGYALMPSHHIHQFTCKSSCLMFLSSDGIFDTHYVDKSGNEITPAEAMEKKKK